MNKKQIEWFQTEAKMLDTLYAERMKRWKRLAKAYDLEFQSKIRDLKSSEYVKISEFYPLVRQVVATVAMNYPTMFFEVLDDESQDGDIEPILERAAAALLEITDAKSHVHQAVTDALFCGIGWIRTDYNPPGQDLTSPYLPNSEQEEDLPSFSRVAPGMVHVDPTTQPNNLGTARYIREKLWIPLKSLMDDKSIKKTKELKASPVDRGTEVGFGELMFNKDDDDEAAAVRSAIENGEFVLVDRWHMHWPIGSKRCVMFAPGVDEPLKDVVHPFSRRVFQQRTDVLGRPLFDDPETQTDPILDVETTHKDGELGEPGVGWLVEHWFPFTPAKFDVHPTSYYPPPHLAYMEDIQNGLVESFSREASFQKRFARQGVVEQAEIDANPKGEEIVTALKNGEDGEWHVVADKNHFMPLDYGNGGGAQWAFADRLRFSGDRISQVADLKQSGSSAAQTATEAALIGASVSINRQWMEAAVSGAYVGLTRNANTIMGDPRFTPERFIVNVAPDGQQKVSRILTNADFLWAYRIRVQTGSLQPLFEEMQKTKALEFFDRAIQMPHIFDQRELAKFMASAFADIDPEKLMVDDVNQEAAQAARNENRIMMTTGQDPGVFEGQDHQGHLQVHPEYQNDAIYLDLANRAQQQLANGQMADPGAAQQVQMIDYLMQQHMQAHSQAQDQELAQSTSPPQASPTGPDSVIGAVQSGAAVVADQVAEETASVG